MVVPALTEIAAIKPLEDGQFLHMVVKNVRIWNFGSLLI